MAIGPLKDEAQRILQLKQGQTEAAALLMDHYGEALMRYLFSILGNRESAEDVFQEVWVKVMEKIGLYKEDMPFAPWLFRIARNAAYDALKGRRRWWSLDTGSGKGMDEDVPELESPLDLGHEVITQQTVGRLMNKLSPDHREVLMLRFFQDLSYEEIAGLCSLPLGTVKSRLKRGLEHLAKSLGEARNHVQ